MAEVYTIIPAHNEEDGLLEILPQIPRKLGEAVNRVVVISDGSTDKTLQVAQDNGCVALSNPQLKGKGFSLRRGIDNALEDPEFSVGIFMDADTQHRPEYVPLVYETLQSGQPFVICSRFHPQSQVVGVIPLDRRYMNIAMKALFRERAGVELTDPMSGFFGTTTPLLREIRSQMVFDDYGVTPEVYWITTRLGVPIYEIPHPAVYDGVGKLEWVYDEELWANRAERLRQHLVHLHDLEQRLPIDGR